MTNASNGGERIDRIETAMEQLTGRVDTLVTLMADFRESQLQSQQEHLQLLRIMAQQQTEIVEIKREIRDLQAEVKGLQTENHRILEYLFGQQGQGSS
ncbi:hypothetical protein [Argonema antarcticum]|uniref:hypothetical protein n=1 Tax=Argonema antarcticum TaxID=2942763 RepID=UPI00201318FE|nr:hypothetical protein [Argonema antarcticum]MCL1471654.1 hypothetical protein [Argonema antarcticum A004/B2]